MSESERQEARQEIIDRFQELRPKGEVDIEARDDPGDDAVA